MMRSSPDEHEHGGLLITEVRNRRFVAVSVAVALLFFLLVNTLTVFTPVLDGSAFGAVTWAYVLGIGQFAVAVVIGHLYLRAARRWEGRDEEGDAS